jgi:hypothetical protein
LKQPSILDVVHGVKTVAPGHPEVQVWWYTPPQRLRLAGELPSHGAPGSVETSLEVVVQGARVDALRCAQIAKELSLALSGTHVGVRLHRGDREERPLFRIVSKKDVLAESPASDATHT